VNPAPRGTIQIKATLNGNSSWTGNLNCNLNGPAASSFGFVPATFSNITTGQYSLNCAGGPGTLQSISSSPSQNLEAGQTVTFTLNFVSGGSPPTIWGYYWNMAPRNRVAFSGFITGTGLVQGTQVYFCVNQSSVCYQHPPSLVTLYNPNTLSLSNINLTTDYWQIFLKTQFGKFREVQRFLRQIAPSPESLTTTPGNSFQKGEAGRFCSALAAWLYRLK
jgi:hypothetical protein